MRVSVRKLLLLAATWVLVCPDGALAWMSAVHIRPPLPSSKPISRNLGPITIKHARSFGRTQPGITTLSSKTGPDENWQRFTAAAVLTALLVSLSTPFAMSPPTAFLDVQLVKNIAEVVTVPSQIASAFANDDAKLEPSEKNTIKLYKENKPSVVFITSLAAARNQFSMNIEEMPQGSGSGFVWDDQGHIVTNFHVIRSANAAQVGLLDREGKTTTYNAKLTGADPDKDIAVLQIDAPKSVLRPVAIGKSSDLEVGQLALAIGNPFGLDHTLTLGVVSGLGRETNSPTGRPISNVIQTDAAINPGNSGGALLDSQGRLIGMNTAIYSPSGASAGIGFAIPSDTVKQVVNSIIKNGQNARPAIGISFLESKQSKQLGIPEGVLILEVSRGSPAQKAGLQGTVRTARGIEIGDIIVGLDGTKIKSELDLFKALEGRQPGEEVTITALRLGEQGYGTINVKVQLAAAADPMKQLQGFRSK